MADTSSVGITNASADVGKLLSVDVVDIAESSKAGDSFSVPALLEIATPNGFRLRVPRTIDPQQLGDLLTVITGVATC